MPIDIYDECLIFIVTLNVVMPNVVMPNVIMPNVVMPNVVMPNVGMPNVVILSVVAPNALKKFNKRTKLHIEIRKTSHELLMIII